MKKVASLTIAVALGCAGATWAQDQDQALTKQQVVGDLTQQGYSDIHDVGFRDGVWTARARSGDGSRVKLRVDPVTGKAYPNKQVSRMEEADVRAMLSEEGFTHVHDLDFEHGIWTARAKNPNGERVSLKIDAQSGRIIGTN
ncbi:PepSY domain-containing protein [Dyella sp. 2HG41-7]|uniref:PepSY domain-containing protein n=1 Tax=Dyella sp. 2HG41-7 TaxID=2883239 RepID=UPI001F3562EB|nr:PepSY domain-containing protein [Dyella sp. 2HG41-7]